MIFLGHKHPSQASEGNNVCSLEQDEDSECHDLFRTLSTVIWGQQMCNRTKRRRLSLHSSISSVHHCDLGRTKVFTLCTHSSTLLSTPESSTFVVMESTTQQLSTYPHLIPLAISEANHHRRQPKIRSMSDYETQRLRRSDSFMNYNYHINTTSTRPRHMISGSSTPESKYRPHHRKGELRYDFKFGNGFEQKEDARFKHARHRRDRSSVFTVASARTLCSIPSETPTPISPSPSFLDLYSPSLPPSPTVASNPAYATTSHSTLTPLELQDCIKHGRYCRLKTFLLDLLHLDFKLPSSASTPRSSMRTICNHKFHHGRCKRCDLPEAILPYLDGGLLTSGFHCRDFGCEACSDMHVSVQEEEWAERTPSPLDISDEAPQIDVSLAITYSFCPRVSLTYRSYSQSLSSQSPPPNLILLTPAATAHLHRHPALIRASPSPHPSSNPHHFPATPDQTPRRQQVHQTTHSPSPHTDLPTTLVHQHHAVPAYPPASPDTYLQVPKAHLEPPS